MLDEILTSFSATVNWNPIFTDTYDKPIIKSVILVEGKTSYGKCQVIRAILFFSKTLRKKMNAYYLEDTT